MPQIQLPVFPASCTAITDELAFEPRLHRFTLVFDREGYSPALFARLKTQRIAILTYHKHPGEDWQETEFTPHQVTLQNGDTVTLPLAERGTQLGNGLWVREIRRLDEKGHQTSILSTDFRAADFDGSGYDTFL